MPESAFERVARHSRLRTLESRRTLQRLFASFPNNWPGIGLVLIRVCLSLALFYFASASLSGKPSEPIRFAQNSIAAARGHLSACWSVDASNRSLDRPQRGFDRVALLFRPARGHVD